MATTAKIKNEVSIPKDEYQRILKTQKELRSQIAALQEFVIEMTKEELKPLIIKRLEKRSKAIDQGKGKHFRSLSSFKSHLRQL